MACWKPLKIPYIDATGRKTVDTGNRFLIHKRVVSANSSWHRKILNGINFNDVSTQNGLSCLPPNAKYVNEYNRIVQTIWKIGSIYVYRRKQHNNIVYILCILAFSNKKKISGFYILLHPNSTYYTFHVSGCRTLVFGLLCRATKFDQVIYGLHRRPDVTLQKKSRGPPGRNPTNRACSQNISISIIFLFCMIFHSFLPTISCYKSFANSSRR